MRPYLLLTPGPLTTSETVKEAMMSDWCTWDEDYNVGIVEVIRKELVELASSRPEEYTALLRRSDIRLGHPPRRPPAGCRQRCIRQTHGGNSRLLSPELSPDEVRRNPTGRPGTGRRIPERASRSDTRICSALRNHHRCAQSKPPQVCSIS